MIDKLTPKWYNCLGVNQPVRLRGIMCNHCEKSEDIFEFEYISAVNWFYGYNKDKAIKYDDLLMDTMCMFIDRGYLRFVDKEESQCLDHGSKVKINYCPFCGEKIMKKMLDN